MGIIWKVKLRTGSTPHRKGVAGTRMAEVWRRGKEGHIEWDFYAIA